MSCISPLPEHRSRGEQRYESVAWFESESVPGVRFGVRRVSLGRKIELVRRIREVGGKAEFLAASDDVCDKLDAALVSAEIDRMYVEWGLCSIEGITFDEVAATMESLVERGPIALTNEILTRIKAECGLSETERKN
jgi:hypothetical protein